ncbi:clotting factor C [Manduca sexta]|nr:clotting factor C [Manduca sexta]
MWVQAGVILSVVSVVCAGYVAHDHGFIESVPFVSGGYRVKSPDLYPWHAGLYTKTTNPYKQICGGTVVSKRAIISAAHCFTLDRHIPPASQYAVAAGKVYRPWNDPHDTTAQKSDVREIKIPPRYQGSAANFQDDIAVVILTKEFVIQLFVTPACVNFNPDLEEAQLREGELGKVVGWGLTGENSPASQVLQGAILPVVSIAKCIEQSPAGFRSSITGDKICAGYDNGTAVCRGDSGGGLVFHAKWQLLQPAFLRGVVSTSPTSENMCNIHTWATFTDVHKHERFLKSVLPDIEKSCELPPNHNFISTRFTGANQRSQNDCCSCQCIQPYEVEYKGKIFELDL